MQRVIVALTFLACVCATHTCIVEVGKSINTAMGECLSEAGAHSDITLVLPAGYFDEPFTVPSNVSSFTLTTREYLEGRQVSRPANNTQVPTWIASIRYEKSIYFQPSTKIILHGLGFVNPPFPLDSNVFSYLEIDKCHFVSSPYVDVLEVAGTGPDSVFICTDTYFRRGQCAIRLLNPIGIPCCRLHHIKHLTITGNYHETDPASHEGPDDEMPLWLQDMDCGDCGCPSVCIF